MTAGNTSTLSLAGRLRDMGDTELTSLIETREVREAGIKDYFDLADALLDRTSLQKALSRLPRATLAALAAAGEQHDNNEQHDNDTQHDGVTAAQIEARLEQLRSDPDPETENGTVNPDGSPARASTASIQPPEDADVAAALERARTLALIDRAPDRASNPDPAGAGNGDDDSNSDQTDPGAGTAVRWLPYAPVSEQLRSWPSQGLSNLAALASEFPPAGLVPVSTTDSRFVDNVAAERAFATTNAVAELVAELQREPARELARGGIALPDSKRLAASLGVPIESVPAIVDVARRAELVGLDPSGWLPGRTSADWMLLPSALRWATLAQTWFARLPDDIRALLASRSHAIWGDRLAEYVHWLYPAGADWMRERALSLSRNAELLGITANHVPSTAGSTLLSSGADAAARAIAELFPPEIDRVYVQHDLSIVSPGPLLARLDARLRTMADVESRALATNYRVTPSSMNRALASGETAESILEFLSGISLTGIPQPLNYLVTGTAARYGVLRVGAIDGRNLQPGDVEGARTYIRSKDASLLGTVAVDQSLSSLDIRRVEPHRAVTRLDIDTVFWTLNEARYSPAAENAKGEIIQLERHRTARLPTPSTEPPAAAIVRKLRLAAESTNQETGQAWMERQLDMAVRGKIALTVTVRMPNGSTTDFELEPASVGGGRLRARDRRSDLERTLPLSSIVAITPGGDL